MASRNGEQESLKKKVAKVREVVSTVSTNDIVLALHSFDLDVEKTIRALCEQGVNSVIGDWETTKHAPVKKNRKQRRLELNSQKSQVDTGKSSTTGPSTTTTPTTNNIINNTKGPSQSKVPVTSTTTPSKVSGQQNVTLPPPGPKTQPVTSVNNTNQVKNKQNQGKDSSSIPTSASDIENIFKQIRQALDEREKYLLTQVKSHSQQFFNVDPSNILTTIKNFGQLSSINNKSTIISSPSSSRPNSNNSLKNATSHSSLVSSVGDDSGLGQVSPVSVKDKQKSSDRGTSTVAINEGGINMESDSFSVDQLAEIQRKLYETLSAQGIDISLVQSMAENTPSTFINRNKQNQQKFSKIDSSNSKSNVGKNKFGKGIQA
uniref:CUE domain-containing protein n=1 Tax=Strongyloides venezuelensis TaxID=75913 RepID=A0A0K0FGR8_STRVS